MSEQDREFLWLLASAICRASGGAGGRNPELENARSLIQDQVPDDWNPTPENINALPKPIRDWIHELETRCDPARDLRRLRAAEDTIEALRVRVRELSDLRHAANLSEGEGGGEGG